MDKLSIISSFLKFLKERKKYWLLPIVIIFLLVGLLLIITQGSVIAPFIYTMF